jgi:DNA-binding PadR family transcriptional regulator
MMDTWTKQTGSVPRGLLRLLVLGMLMEKPMSGSEIVDVIEKETAGKWKPSSGSVYPLLARLQEKGYTVESPREETGTKRYALTSGGQAFFEKQIILGQELVTKLGFLIPIVIGWFQWFQSGLGDEKILSALKEPARRIVGALLEIRSAKGYQLTEKESKRIEAVLNKCANEFEAIVHRIRVSIRSNAHEK